MTRAEARKQVNTGWVTRQLARMFLGLDLDIHKVLDEHVKSGAIDTWVRNGVLLFRLDDVLRYANATANELIDKYWPINRQRKPERQQIINALTTAAQRGHFHEKWGRLHRQVSGWIEDPEAKIPVGELKLAFQLLERSRRVKAFNLCLTTAQLEKATGLDKDSLPKARRALMDREMFTAERNGTLGWFYRLYDPNTKQPFEDNTETPSILVIASDSWAD